MRQNIENHVADRCRRGFIMNLEWQQETIIFRTLVSIIITIISANGIMCEERKIVTKEEAIQIATKEVITLGKDINSMELKTISKHSQPWNRYFSKETKSQGIIVKKDMLKDREYWAVSYYKKRQPGQNIKGGGVCVFIDSHTGEILTTYRIK